MFSTLHMSREIQQPTHDNRCFHRVISATRLASQVDYKIFPTPHHLTHHHHHNHPPLPTAPHNERTHRHTHTHHQHQHQSSQLSVYRALASPWALGHCLFGELFASSTELEMETWLTHATQPVAFSFHHRILSSCGRRSTALAPSTHNKRRTLINLTKIHTFRPTHEVTLPEIVAPFILQDHWICTPQPTMTMQRV